MKKEETDHEIFNDKYESKPETGSLEVVKHETFQMPRLSVDNIDALDDADAAPIELSSEYYTPKLPGEVIRVIFDRIDISLVPDMNNSDNMIELECAFFMIKENGNVKQICNGSRRLVGTLNSFKIQKGTPLQITYEGKVKNKTGSFYSDSWSIVPLIPKKK